MQKHTLWYGMAIAVFLSLPLATHAQDISYGTLKTQYGNTLLLEYKGPAGPQYYTCSITGTCTSRGTTTPNILPTVLGSREYTASTDGRLAVRPFTVGTIAYYFLYDLETKSPTQVARIPYTVPNAHIYIAKNNTAIVFRDGRTFTRYDVARRSLDTITLKQDLAFLALSPDATYVTGYNYNTLRHELWRFSDGTRIEGPSSMQSYLEFSEDESRVAFLEDVDTFKTLYSMETAELGKTNPRSLVQLTEPNTETEDYLYIDDTLYFLANVEGPLDWHLYAYDGTESVVVDEHVSYGDFLKRVRTATGSYLAYLKTEGKNTHVVLTRPDKKTSTVLSPAGDSPLSDEVKRTVDVVADRYGVLLTPETPARKPALFLWLHGGPQRQVSSAVSYHPYLSYAVYDELLDRLAEGGHYVYKMDYIGSSGYGAEFRKALHMNIGKIEMRDVERAVKELARDLDVDTIYLIGNSYGGYMALRGIVEFPTLVDGAISINGVSDWYGLIQRIPSSPFASLFNGPPDAHNLDAYFQASVFLGMDTLTTTDKVLVVWGEKDTTVPPSQSEQYVEYATAQGLSLETLVFPDEDHIIRKRENLDALCERITSYFEVRGVSCSL